MVAGQPVTFLRARLCCLQFFFLSAFKRVDNQAGGA